MSRRLSVLALGLLLVAGPALAGQKYSHQEYFERYEGTQTCLTCHEDEAKAFFHSQHYQWRGETPQLINSHGGKHGKLDMVNDFCTNPVPNWIGEVKNDDGKVLAAGCSKCHAGLGLLPSPVMSQEQLENIDCLICHASGYRKGVYRNDQGSWEWRPILWKNQEGLDSVSKRISRPTRAMCLRCHSASGGGPNYKRGDIEYTLTDAEPEFDVHMASEGNDLTCADCHAGQDHRVIGRGADLVATDSPNVRLTCDNGMCHESAPHAQALLNTHGARVACTTCHIPAFAKGEATDMLRDWSDTRFVEEKGKHAPRIELESNVLPTYAWYDGTTTAQLPRTPVRTDAEGRVLMMTPGGSREDPTAKIFPFKVHRGKLPVATDTKWLLPIQTEEFYAHGDIDRAIREAAEISYGLHDVDYTWAETTRFMSINHGVEPAEHALRCLDCHGPDGRLDWTALGYEKDPMGDCLDSSQ